MSSIWARMDGRLPHEQRHQVLLSHQFGTDMGETGDVASMGEVEENSISPFQCSNISIPSASALIVSPDVRITYSQGKTSIIVSLSGPTTAKRESTYEKAEVVFRLQSRVGVLAVQPLLAVGSAPEKRRFFEARHQQLHETYASVLLFLLQNAAESVLCLEQFPRCVIVIDVLVQEEDGGLCAAVLNGVMCAILQAGIPCRTSFAAVTVAALTGAKKRASVEKKQTAVDDSESTNQHSLQVHQKRKREDDSASTDMEAHQLSSEGEKFSSSTHSVKQQDAPIVGSRSDSNALTGQSLCYFVDPTSLEETLSGCPSKGSVNISNCFSPTSHKGDSTMALGEESQAAVRATTERGQLLKLQQECRTVAVGTFVMTYSPGDSSSGGHPTIASHVQSGPGMARASSEDSLSPEEWLQMQRIANISATRIFDFYRKLNEPLE